MDAIEYHDEKGNLVASTLPRENVSQSIEERMLEAVREGRLIDPDLFAAIHFAVAECSREVRSCGTMPFGDQAIRQFAARLYEAIQRGQELDRGGIGVERDGKFTIEPYPVPLLPAEVAAYLAAQTSHD